MQTNDLTPEKLRELADLRPANARVLSLFLNLDPDGVRDASGSRQRGPVAARPDRAPRQGAEGERRPLARRAEGAARRHRARAPVVQQRRLRRQGRARPRDLPRGPADLFEVVKLPAAGRDQRGRRRLAVHRADRRPGFAHALGRPARSRARTARILRGTADGLREVDQLYDDTHGQHQQGGWSQARYQRSVEEEKKDHIRAVADVLFEHHKRAPIDCLLVGCNEEIYGDVQSSLHTYLSERLVGRFDVDVEASSADDVFQAAKPKIEEHDSQREREALDRLVEGVRRRRPRRRRSGRHARRAERAARREAPHQLRLRPGRGAVPACGSLYAASVTKCPADETPTEKRDSITETAIERALAQSAEVHVVRYHGAGHRAARQHRGRPALLARRMDFRELALSMPEATEKEAWGHPTFRVRNKMFASAATDLSTATVKSTLDEQRALTQIGAGHVLRAEVRRQARLDRDRSSTGSTPTSCASSSIEAWRMTAPKRLVKAWDEEHPVPN